MKQPDGATQSSWYEGIEIPQYSPLKSAARADVCVVGAGIAGLSTAYQLLLAGFSVLVLDEGAIGSGQTGRTSAHLASAIDDRFMEIERLHGVEKSKLAYQSHARAIDVIEVTARREKVHCQFARLNGLLSAVPSDPPDYLDRELAAAHRAGFQDAEILPSGGIANARCIRFPNQARFHPLMYLAGLAGSVSRLGGQIHTGLRVTDVQGFDPKSGKPAQIKLQGGPHVTADSVVVATNTPAPINDWFGIYTKQASYRTYVIAGEIPKDSVPDALYWDTGDPYHYVRVEPRPRHKTDLLLIGGEDHKTGQFDEQAAPFLELELWGKKHFPGIGEIRHRWSGQVQEPADGVAFIGAALTKKENVYVITGDSGMGLTHAALGAVLITDLIQGKQNPWQDLYDPSRKILNTDFLAENANVVARFTELVTPGEVKSLDEIPNGFGAVIREGLHKIAAFRDDNGKVHRHTALCTHLQCVVHWNHVEKSWDCPCHGSRFDPTGKVLIGPAITDLPKA